MYLVLPRSPQTSERSSNRSRDAALTRFEWKKWPPLPEEANQRDLDEMAPSVDSLNAPDRVNSSPVDGSWRLDFAGAPHCDQYHCSSDERLNRQVLLHLPVSLSSRPARPTDDSQEHITIGRSHIARGWPWPCRPAERTSSAREGPPVVAT